MKPDEIAETFDEISTQLYRLGERLEELQNALDRLDHRVNNLVDSDSRRLCNEVDPFCNDHERRIDHIIRQGRFS